MTTTINASTTAGLVSTADTSGILQLQTANTTAVTIDASQNVGIGTTPSAWLNTWKAMQVGYGAVTYTSSNSSYLSSNWYYDGASKYIGTGSALVYEQNHILGNHYWYGSTSGTAGGSVTLVERMRIDSSGVITSPLGGMQVMSGTAVASTSGTSITFTGIPSWAKRVTVMFNGVSTNGTSIIQCQIGPSGGVETSSYLGSLTASGGGAVANVALSAGITFYNSNAATNVWQGSVVFSLLNSATNTWSFTSLTAKSDTVGNGFAAGSKALAGALSTVRITTVNGTDTFDAGTINILYE